MHILNFTKNPQSRIKTQLIHEMYDAEFTECGYIIA